MSQRCWARLLLVCFPVLLIHGVAALVAPVQQDTSAQPQLVWRHTTTATAAPAAANEQPPEAFPLAAMGSATRPSNGSEGPGGGLEVLHAVEQEGVRLVGFDFEDVEIPLIIAIFFFGVGILKISAPCVPSPLN